jgi:hypothetical protein
LVLAALLTSLLAWEPVIRLLPSPVVCPRAEEVERQLALLLPSAVAVVPGRPDVATLEDVEDRLRVTLAREDGTLLGRRELTTKASCGELASAVALVLAMWESDVHPEFVLELPAATVPPPEVAPPLATPVPAPPAARATSTVAEAQALPRHRGALDFGVAFGVVAAAQAAEGPREDHLTWSAALVGAWLPSARGWGGQVTIFGDGERAQSLPVGEARWRRAGGSLGPVFRWYPSRGRTHLDLHAELMVAALGVRGAGLGKTAEDWSLDEGGAAGVRVRVPLSRRWCPWLGLGVEVWPRKQVVYTRPDGESASLPRAEVTLSLGVSFDAWPRPKDDSL